MGRRRAATTGAITIVALAMLATLAAHAAPARAADPAPFTGLPCTLTAPAGNTDSLATIRRDAYPIRARGTVRAVMLFIDFDGAEAASDESTRALYRQLALPARARYLQSSGGRMRLGVTPLHRWLRLPASAARLDPQAYADQRQLLALAIAKADPSVDFSRTQLVYTVSALAGAHPLSPAFIAGRGSGIRADGAELRFGSTLGSDVRAQPAGAWIVTHETGHLLGLPDLYAYAPTGTPPDYHPWAGSWDLMGDLYVGAGFSQWTRNLLGWIPPSQVRCLRSGGGGEYVLHPQARPRGVQLLRVPTGRSTAVGIEQRTALGIDSPICTAGVLVYRIDARTATGRGPMRVVTASRAAGSCGVLSSAPYRRGEGATCSVVVDGIRIEVVAQAGVTSTVRVRPSGSTPDPRVTDCAG